MRTQDKNIEKIVGSGTPEEEWLEDSQGYRVRRTHLELLQLTQLRGQLILDAGCGPGTYGIMLAQEGNEVVGIEISHTGAIVAKKRANEKRATFLPMVGDIEKLPFKDNSFDICFCGWVLHHFPDMGAAVVELSRVLKPGGTLALAEPNESNTAMRFSRLIENLPLLRRWVLKAGWDTPNRTVHKHEHYIEALERQGFTDIKFASCFPGGLPPLPVKSQKRGFSSLSLMLIHIFVRLRRLLFIIANKMLPPPLNGADLLITGTKA